MELRLKAYAMKERQKERYRQIDKQTDRDLSLLP